MQQLTPDLIAANTLSSKIITRLFSWMGIQDSVNHVYESMIPAIKSAYVWTYFQRGNSAPLTNQVKTAVMSVPARYIVQSGSSFVRLAGLSGAAAVALGAYGAHAFYQKQILDERKQVFETANKYHFLHTLALLAVPLTRRPAVCGTMLLMGMALFCGTCYHFALTGNKDYRCLTPYGGMLLITAWITFAL